jgi:nucleoside-diphosphate-sugar epimerase
MEKDLMNYSVFGGTGFVGGNFCDCFPENVIIQKREDRKPSTKNILYFISTVDNYNVFNNITLDVETNLKVLCEVLENCKEEGTVFNFVSSWFVYGDVPLPAREEYYCKPTGFYSITKKAAEDLIISFCKTFKVDYRILRLCNVLGSGDGKVSAKKNALTYMVDCLKKDEDVFLYDEGTPVRDVMHVTDVCRAIDLVCREGKLNEIYNIGSGQPTCVGDIISSARTYLNSSSEIKSKPAPEFHQIVQTKDFWMDTTKLCELGFEQLISNDLIIKELCQ